MKTSRPKTVYAIYCIVTKRVYIGCTANFEPRAYQHFNELKNGNKTMNVGKMEREDSQWQKDYNAHGRAAFSVYILERDVPADKADDVELSYILKYRANDPQHGYNIRPTRRAKLEIAEGAPPLPAV